MTRVNGLMTVRITGGPAGYQLRVEDADTGEMVPGVTEVEIKANAQGMVLAYVTVVAGVKTVDVVGVPELQTVDRFMLIHAALRLDALGTPTAAAGVRTILKPAPLAEQAPAEVPDDDTETPGMAIPVTERRNWTRPRRIALRTFRSTGTARESNITMDGRPHQGATVYWQTLRWLVDEYLVVQSAPGSDEYELTEAGRRELEHLLDEKDGPGCSVLVPDPLMASGSAPCGLQAPHQHAEASV